MSERTVLVTGASGGIGRRLVPVLRERGWRVRALVHRRPAAGADEAVTGDLLKPVSLRDACEGVAAVLHLAAVTHARSERAYMLANARATEALATAAADAGATRFAYVSTHAIDQAGGWYSRSKAAGERALEAAAVEHVIVRLPEVYGAGAGEGVDRIVSAARAGRPIALVGDGSALVRPVHVSDVVGALAAALDSPAAAGRTYTLGGEEMTMRALAERCRTIAGGRSRIVGVPRPALRTLSLAGRLVPVPVYPDQLARLAAPRPAPTPEAESDLGYRPRPLEQSLREG